MRAVVVHAGSMAAACAALLLSALPLRAQEADIALGRTAHVEDPRPLGVGRVLPDIEFAPVRGEKRSLSAILKDHKLVVIAAIGATCPMSIEYAPRLAAMEKELAPRGVAFVYLNAVDAETIPDMEGQVKRHRLEGPYLPDREHTVRRALHLRTTTEAFVVDASRTLLYRGAVDDQFGIGDALPEAKHAYLADAIEAALAGSRPRIRATWAPGCLVDSGARMEAGPAGPATYNGRIAWIMSESCVSCHRSGGAGPFPLDSYETVVGRAKMIQAVVSDGLMPPWHGVARSSDPNQPSPWVTDRSLSKDDRDALIAWLSSDRPRGEEVPPPALPELPRSWAIGEPDLLLTTSGVRLGAKGGMQHGRVMVGFPVREEKWLSAIELRPVEMGSVHHALVWMLAPGDVLPQVDEMPGSLELVATYSPGDNVLRYPTGVARRMRPGSILLVDLYAKPMGKEVISALRVGMKWGTSPTLAVRSITTRAGALQPDGATGDLAASANLAIPPGTQLLSITPYLRSRGRSYSISGGAANGVPALVDAPRHDFRWIVRYELLEPRVIPDGQISIRARYRPSADPAVPVLQLGSESETEALLLSAEVLQAVSPPK